MSLTSYRAAPPRVEVFCALWSARCVLSLVMRDILDRPGNDLLSRVLRHSTIGAETFNGRVRDGIGFWRLAQATGPAKDMASKLVFVWRASLSPGFCLSGWTLCCSRLLVSRTLIMRTIKPIEQLVPVS